MNVLSYNISFGAMKSDENGARNNKSAKFLAEYCKELRKKEGRNICLNNVTEYLSKAILEDKVDFIATQESSNWDKIYEQISELAGGFWSLNGSLGVEDMASFMKVSKFSKIDAVIIDKIGTRPFHIILTNLEKIDKKCIMINLHNIHADPSKGSPIEFLEKNLSKSINDKLGYKIPNMNSNYIFKSRGRNVGRLDLNQKSDKEIEITDISKIIETYIKPIIIVLADFNDYNNKYWKGLTLFRGTPLETIVKSTKPKNNTCCVGRTSLRTRSKILDTHSADYILINDQIKFSKENYLPTEKQLPRNANFYPTSDHLPVLAKLMIDTKSSLTHKQWFYPDDKKGWLEFSVKDNEIINEQRKKKADFIINKRRYSFLSSNLILQGNNRKAIFSIKSELPNYNDFIKKFYYHNNREWTSIETTNGFGKAISTTSFKFRGINYENKDRQIIRDNKYKVLFSFRTDLPKDNKKIYIKEWYYPDDREGWKLLGSKTVSSILLKKTFTEGNRKYTIKSDSKVVQEHTHTKKKRNILYNFIDKLPDFKKEIKTKKGGMIRNRVKKSKKNKLFI